MHSYLSKLGKDLGLWVMLFIYINIEPNMDNLQNIIYFVVDTSHQVDIFYDRNLNNFLVMVSNNSKYKAMIWIQELLVKERNDI